MQVQVSKWGDGTGVQLPVEALEELGAAMGDRLELLVERGRIVLELAETVVEVRPSSHSGENPMHPLPAIELAEALRVGEEEVREREAAGRLFSIVKAGHGAEHLFPAFQAWPEISGRTLEAVLCGLNVKKHGGSAAYAFFMARDDRLGYLTPVEVLIGSVTRTQVLAAWIVEGLSLPAGQRLGAVLKAAEAYVGTLEGW